MKLCEYESIENEAARSALESAGVEIIRNWDYGVLAESEVLWVRLNPVTAKRIHDMPKLRYVCCPCTGLDHIALDECEHRGVKVISLRGLPGLRDVRATIELTIGLVLSLTRQIPWAFDSVKEGKWDRYNFCGTDLAGKRAGIVGYGRIGQGVAAILQAFGMEVAYHDPNVAGSMPFMELLRWSDLITVHAELNRESRWMFGRTAFEAMKPGAYFVNTARGGLVDENALRESRLAGAALDVMEHEPYVDGVKSRRLIVTPHIGGCTKEAIAATELMVAEALIREVANVVDRS